MKKLYVSTRLPVNPLMAWQLFESEGFRDRLRARTGITVRILDSHREDTVQVQRMHFTTSTELPMVVAKALGSRVLTYEQVNRLDLDAGTMHWHVELPVLSDRVKVSGVTIIRPDGSGCERIVDGSIEVSVRIIGGQIEKAVAAGFERSMAVAVEIVGEMIEEGKLA